ncbi:hypothetical protein M918_06690 [Clostridium sp. BL8]|nr:hypothetical protein M918_06690 [Clostridium sp. BL8]
MNGVMEEVIDDLNSIKKKEIYDLNTKLDLKKDLDEAEKELLAALLITISNSGAENNAYQQKFIRSVNSYIEIKNPQLSIDVSSIENIVNLSSQKAILQVIMEYLFLEYGNFEFLEDYEEGLFDYFNVNKKGVNEIKECIKAIYNATGFEGIAEKYGYVVEEKTEDVDKDKLEKKYNTYDGSDICEKCADIININENYIILKDYLVYCDNSTDKLYRVRKNDGEKVEINSKLDIEITRNIFGIEMLGYGENLFLFTRTISNSVVKVNINTFQKTIIELVGEGSKYQCNEDYFTYIIEVENAKRLVKIDLKNNTTEILKHTVNGENVLTSEEYYLVGRNVYFKPQGSYVVYGYPISDENLLNSDSLYNFNLEEGTLEIICEIPGVSYYFLSANDTSRYGNVLFSTQNGNSYEKLSFSYLDLKNPKAIRNTSIMNYSCDTYPFLAYDWIFYVILDYKMSIRKYNIVTGESSIILESTQCANSYTTGIFKKETHYSMMGTEPQVVGRWLYYLGKTSNTVRKVSIDVQMGESEVLLLDGSPVHRYM